MTSRPPTSRRHRHPAIPLLALILMTPAAASTILDAADAPATSAQDYRDEAEKFPSVGSVSGSGYSGSGVLIGDRWVLTAGHVAFGKSGGGFSLGGTTYGIDRIHTAPGYSFGGLGSDLGLLYLSTAAGDVPAARTHLFSDSLGMIGGEAVWAGHGLTGTGLDGITGAPEFRAFTNIIDAPGDAAGYEDLYATSFVADFDRPDGSTNVPAGSGSSPEATRLEGNVASGDSGGGVFMEIDGEYRLVGISSYSATLDSYPAGTDGRYGALSGATNLQLFHDWIAETSGITPVPEPGAAVLLLAGIAPLLRRRRDS